MSFPVPPFDLLAGRRGNTMAICVKFMGNGGMVKKFGKIIMRS